MKCVLLALFSFIVSFPATCQLLIAPTRFVLDAERSVTEKIVVENTSDQPLRLDIKAVYRPIASQGVRRLSDDVEREEDISDFLQISPPIIRKLNPNQRRTIRLRLKTLPSDKAKGEYRAYVRFSPTVSVASAGEDKTAPAFALNFKLNTYIPVYVQKGQPTQDVSIQCEANGIRIQNKSNYQFNALLKYGDWTQNLVVVRNAELIKTLPNTTTEAQLIQHEQVLQRCSF
ncbi:fimbrial biogenesis chaperone [Enterovibrio norvegicus]|uniref:fimbrial biogenesis chaperone n=1 Tax=Enterovibrio norvegicus TaxID=188144 RepID=UPI00354E4A15